MHMIVLVGLIAAVAAGAAQAQSRRNPYDPPKPYELPKEYRTNPYERDFSKPDPATKGPGYHNADGSAASTRMPTPTPSYGGYYGSRTSEPSDYGVNSSRNRRDCGKPGLVC